MPQRQGPCSTQTIGHPGHQATRATGPPAQDSGTACQVCQRPQQARAWERPSPGSPCTPGQAGSRWLHCPASPSSCYYHMSHSHLCDRTHQKLQPLLRMSGLFPLVTQMLLPGAPVPIGLCFCLGHDPLASGFVRGDEFSPCVCLFRMSSRRSDFRRTLLPGIGPSVGNFVAALRSVLPGASAVSVGNQPSAAPLKGDVSSGC